MGTTYSKMKKIVHTACSAQTSLRGVRWFGQHGRRHRQFSPIAGLLYHTLPSCISYTTGLRDRLQNTSGSAILLVVNKVIPILIGPSKKSNHDDRGPGTWPCRTVRQTAYRRVTEPGSPSLDWAYFGDDS